MKGALVIFVKSEADHAFRRKMARSTYASIKDVQGWKLVWFVSHHASNSSLAYNVFTLLVFLQIYILLPKKVSLYIKILLML